MLEIRELFSKEERRRLEKAAKDKNKEKLDDWARNFELRLSEIMRKDYESKLNESVKNFIIAIVYTLHFNEKCKFGNDRIADFMDDLMAVVEGLGNREYDIEEYKKELKKQKIYFEF